MQSTPRFIALAGRGRLFLGLLVLLGGAAYFEARAETTASVAVTTTTASTKATPDLRDLCSRGDQFRKQGKRREAIKAYEEAVAAANPLAQDPAMERCRYYLGILLYQEGRTEEALEHLKVSAHATPNQAEGWNWLAKAKAEIGDQEGALELWRMVLEKDANFVEARYNIAMVLIKQGKKTEARQELEAAIKQKPDYKEAKQALAKLKSR